jgi:hypothetical protein
MSDEDDDDMPLARRGDVKKRTSPLEREQSGVDTAVVRAEGSSEDDDDLPLVSRSKLTKRNFDPPSTGNGAIESDDDDFNSEDDLPLSRRAISNGVSKVERKQTQANVQPKTNDAKTKTKLGKEASASKRNAKANASAKISKKPRKAVSEQKAKSRVKKSQKTNENNPPARKFELPGQRREIPGKSEPLRLFYETMYKERIDLGKPSGLAETWMLHHGLLEPKVAARICAARVRSN